MRTKREKFSTHATQCIFFLNGITRFSFVDSYIIFSIFYGNANYELMLLLSSFLFHFLLLLLLFVSCFVSKNILKNCLPNVSQIGMTTNAEENAAIYGCFFIVPTIEILPKKKVSSFIVLPKRFLSFTVSQIVSGMTISLIFIGFKDFDSKKKIKEKNIFIFTILCNFHLWMCKIF